MAIKPFLATNGLAVGDPAANIILANGDITTSNVTATANVNAAYFTGNGFYLTGISGGGGASIANGTSNVNIVASGGNVNTSVGGAANVLVVTGTGANVSGTANVTGNLYAGNADLGNLASANFLQGDGYLISNLTVGSGSAITNGTSNVSVAASGNVTVGVAGNAAIITVTGTGANIAGTANISGNANVGNIGATSFVGTTVNVSGQLISTQATGTAPFVVNSTTLVANLFAANATFATSAGSATGTAATVTTAAQPNITSVGTLTGLIVGNGTANINLVNGSNGNVSITGNLSTGNVSATNHTGTTVNVTGQLISTQTTGTAPFVVNSTTAVANLAAATAGSATTAGTVTTAAQPNITSVGTLTALLAGNGTANVNLVNGSNGNMSVTGNITAGNISATNHTGTNVNVTGQLISTVATATAPLVITSTTLVPNLYVARANVSDFDAITTVTTGNYYLTMASAITGNIAQVGNAAILANVTTGTLYATKFFGDGGLLSNITATGGASITNGTSNVVVTASGNVSTSVAGNANIVVDTGTGSNINGYLTVTGVTTLGPVGNVKITGGSANQFLQTNGTGTLVWATPTGGGGSSGPTLGAVLAAARGFAMP